MSNKRNNSSRLDSLLQSIDKVLSRNITFSSSQHKNCSAEAEKITKNSPKNKKSEKK